MGEYERAWEVLKRNWKRLRSLPNVLSVAVGSKWKRDVNTGEPCIVVFVKRKVPLSFLATDEVVPKEIDGVKTDVVELSASDYAIGETSVSRRDPETQRRIAGGVIVDPC